VPTLNEQYRVFRVRSDVTMANESLRPEQLTGGELGVQQRWGPFEGRVTGYWNDVHDLIANVTLTGRLPDCPVGTTCRQRQNLDLARIRGIEAELDLRIAGD
jgi:vitamin B12 transporter